MLDLPSRWNGKSAAFRCIHTCGKLNIKADTDSDNSPAIYPKSDVENEPGNRD
jgi:hypothetical protein